MVGKVPSCVRPQVQRAGAAAVEMDQVKREVAAGVARVPVSMVRVEGAAPLLPRPSLHQKGPRRGARLDSWALSALGARLQRLSQSGGVGKRRTRGITRYARNLSSELGKRSALSVNLVP